MSLNSFGNKLRTGPLGAVFFGIVVLCVGVLAFTGLGQYNRTQKDAAPVKAPSDILATVDSTPITVAEFQHALTTLKEQYSAYGPPLSILQSAQIRAGTFNQVEMPILQAALAKEHNLDVSQSDIDAQHQIALKQIKTELSLPASASDSDVDTALQSQNMSIADVIDDKAIKTGLLAQKYQTYVTQSNQATEQQVLNYYTQVHTRHILISSQKRPAAQALALATDLINRLKKGADFVTLVKQYSDDTASIKSGGDDKFIDQSTSYVPEFKSAALALKAGQFTETPVFSPEYGYFIIQALQVRSNLPKDYQKNHANYVAQVSQSLAQQQMQSEMAAEKAKAVVNIIDPRLKGDLAFETTPSESNPQAALAAYDQALKNGDESDKAEIYASEAEIYAELNQTDKQTTALQNALQTTEDPAINMMLGDVYKQKGDVTDALKQYQLASQNSFDDPNILAGLIQDYKALKQPALEAQTVASLKQYEAQQKQASAGQSPP